MAHLLIAHIVGVHGIRGLVKLRTDGDTLPELAKAGALIDRHGQPVPVLLKSQLRGNWLAEIKGVADRTAAERLIGMALYAERTALPETDDDEFYVDDLIGMTVKDESGQIWGEITAVENYGAGDLLEIRLHNGATEMLPFSDGFVPAVEEDHVQINPPPDWPRPRT